MNNLPKLSSNIQSTQFNSINSNNTHNRTHINQTIKLTTLSQSRNLSPFTWNNIKLPNVLNKQKYLFINTNKQKQSTKINQINKPFITIDSSQINRLKTITQKNKRSLNVSTQHKKIRQNKQSPLKNLHQQVLKQYQKRKFTSDIKKRDNKSFTQKNNNMNKAYQTLNLKTSQPLKQFIQSDKLKNTQQRYRNVKSIYQTQVQRAPNTTQNKRYTFNQYSDKKIPQIKTKFQYLKSNQNQKSIHQLNNSIIIKQSRNSIQNHHSYNNHSSTSIYQQMQPYIKNYLKNSIHKSQPNKLKIFVTTNPKYHPLHMNQHNSSAFQNGHSTHIYSHTPHISHTPHTSHTSHTPHTPHTSYHKTLIWTKNESQNIFRQKNSQQYYNHVQGSHILTSKQKLHQIFNGGKGLQRNFYPISFSLPKQYNEFAQQYDWTLVKMCLKCLVKQIQKYEKGMNIDIQRKKDQYSIKQRVLQYNICLSDILQDLTRETNNEQQLKVVKYCLYLQQVRKRMRLVQLFEKMKTYRSIQINLSQNIYIDIIQWCLSLNKLFNSNINSNNNSNNNNININNSNNNINQNNQNNNQLNQILKLQNIDYRLLQLLKSYHYLFSTYLPSYLYKTLNPIHNIWLIKPFASSKAAGISLIIDSQNFYTTPDYQYKQFKFKSKFHNKIFMKYIENPFLIKHSAMDYFVKKMIKSIHNQHSINQHQHQQNSQTWKHFVHDINLKVQKLLKLQQKFIARKFDIRQWIIIVCDQENQIIGSQGFDKNLQKSYNGSKSPKNKKVKKIKFYKYHTAYCRFAQKPYSLQTSDLQVHLTNYQLYKKNPLKNGSRSPNKSLNSSVLQKNEYLNSLTDESKGKSQNQQRVNTRKRLGSIAKQQQQSVLMLDELFEYVDFVTKIKQKKYWFNNNSLQYNQVSIKRKYDYQLNKILKSMYDASFSSLVHHSKTFELFGVDLLMDQGMNLYLLQVNLNPGCSSQREQKLGRQANVMVQSMFERVMGVQRRQQQRYKQQELLIKSGKQIMDDIDNDQGKQVDKWILVCSNKIDQN